jgi:tetratricopeptide (TPR) repeat protein
VATKPDLYESNLNLGMLLAQDGQNDEAAKQMKTTIELMPASTPNGQKARNWIALGEVEENHPEDAIAAFRKAAELSPKDAEPHVMTAQVLASNKDVTGAETEYKAALAIDPQSKEALAGLTDLYHGTNREAEEISSLRQYLKGMPRDFNAHKRLGRLLLKSGDAQGAVAEFNAGLKQSSNDIALLHEIAAMYASQKRFDLAAPRYAELVRAKPDDGDYHYQYGVVLMQLHRFPEAQEQLITALQRDPELLDAYGELAVAASENKQYPLVVKALDARSKLAAETPATYFLRATAFDNLKAYPQAAENYHKFLEASQGEFPDNEWKARHRLIAIEPGGGKKKK